MPVAVFTELRRVAWVNVQAVPVSTTGPVMNDTTATFVTADGPLLRLEFSD